MEFRIRQPIAYCQPLPAYWQSQLLCTYCQLYTAYFFLTSEHVWKKTVKISLLRINNSATFASLFNSENDFSPWDKFNHCNNKVPTPHSEFSKNIIYDTMDERKIPNTPTHFFWINSGYTNVYNISYDCFFIFFFIHACTEMKT